MGGHQRILSSTFRPSVRPSSGLVRSMIRLRIIEGVDPEEGLTEGLNKEDKVC